MQTGSTMITRKTSCAIVTLLCVFFAISAQAQFVQRWTFDIFEDATDLMWATPPSTSLTISNGVLHFESQQDGFQTTTMNDSPHERFCVSASVTHVSGPLEGAYGLCFGGSNYDNQYFFEIASDTTFAIGKFENGKWVDLCKWTSNAALHAGEGAHNTLLAKITPGDWKFYINDVLVKTLPAQPLFGGNNGMMVEGFQKIDFDNYYFCIYQGGYGQTEFAEKFNALMADYKNNFANSIGDSIASEGSALGLIQQFKVKDPLPEIQEQSFFSTSRPYYFATFGSYKTRADAVDGYLRLCDLILGGTPPCILSDAGEKKDADGVVSHNVWYESNQIPGSELYAGMIVEAAIEPPKEGVSTTWDVTLQVFTRDN